MAGYSGTPLARKLGVTVGSSVLLDGAPPGFSLGEPTHGKPAERGKQGEPGERGVPGEHGGLPEGVRLARRVAKGAGAYDIIVGFCTSRARLAQRWPILHPLCRPPFATAGLADARSSRSPTTPAGALWIAWPKRSSGVATDLDENVVRDYALAHGRVDVKVCAIDEVRSGLKHVIRKADR